MSASFDILSFVYDTQPVPISAVWQHFGPGNFRETNETIEMLLSRGLLRRSHAAESYLDQLTITAPGREVLEREKQQREAAVQQRREKDAAEAIRLQERHQDHADAERRHRTQTKVAIIMPLVTFVLGLLTEHFLSVVGFIAAAVQRLTGSV